MITCLPATRRVALFLLLSISLPLAAIEPLADSPDSRILPTLRVTSDAIEVQPSVQLDAQHSVLLQARVAGFMRQYGPNWTMRWDARSNRPNLVQGEGIALLPGRGNGLSVASTGLDVSAPLTLDAVEPRARALIAQLDELLDLDGIELQLDRERSSANGVGQSHWFLEFGQYHDGVRVDGAFVFLRVAHGNVIQFGAERIAPVKTRTASEFKREAAFEQAWQQLGFPAGTRIAQRSEPGELRIYPTLTGGELPAMAYSGATGFGYSHQLAWRFVFQVEGDPALWQVLLDAGSGRVIDLRDLTVNVDATVRGGIYPTTNTDTEINVTFPFTAVSNGGNKVTNINGVYDYSGGTATVPLDGQYFRMVDTCGSISLSNTTNGNIDFGGSGGTDCTTPGFGGAGNTHATRSGFYHLTLINAKARAILPTNTWLQGKVTANMNINNTCNASYNGQVNFYRSGGGCSNTGELAAVFLHEWGHGMDNNSGGSASENASGEAVGDTFAFLETRDSCIGPNFRPGVPCYNCTTCTGVRDMQDFSLLGPPTRIIARPDTITADTGINCDRLACPYSTPTGFPYRGPMGYEGHCEALIPGAANWDLTQSLVDRHGEAGWATMDDIWYSSLVPSKSAFRVASGGQCNANASVDGCGATNWYTVFLAADDDDGNLANGTPNGCRIWDAYDAHGIACGTRPECTIDAPDFTLAVSDSPQRVCVGGSAQFGVQVGSNAGFVNPVTLSATGLPLDSSALFSPNPVTPAGSSSLTVSVGAGAVAGLYSLTISGAAQDSPGRSRPADLLVDDAVPGSAVNSAPAQGATGVSRDTVFSWLPVANAQRYSIEVARDAGFTDIVASATDLTVTTFSASNLDAGTHHYWRVRAHNACGDGVLSNVFVFTTAASSEVCRTPNLAIPDNNTTGVSDTLTFASTVPVQNLRLKLTVPHTWVGDLVATLSHNGTPVTAIDRPGVPASTNGCSSNDVDVILDDNAANPVENACAGTPPAIGGTLRPNNLLTPPFAGMSPAGGWTINVSDRVGSDTGTLSRWCVETSATVAAYTVGGTVAGLSGTGLRLTLNSGTESRDIVVNGGFQFITRLYDTDAYSVSIAAQPSGGATCVVQDGSGSVAGANVTDVRVVCGSGATYQVGGTVSVQPNSGLVIALNGTDLLPIAGGGSFQFGTNLPDFSNYAVTIATAPNDPVQDCVLTNATGSINGADVNDVDVSCTVSSFAIGGTVSGLFGSGLRLGLNGSEELPIAANGSFAFATAVADDQPYVVAILQQPADPQQTCTLTNGSGNVDGGDVTSIAVTCVTDAFEIGGSVSGLAGSGLRLALNGGEELAIGANGSFAFATRIDDGQGYTVTVVAQPLVPTQACTVAQGAGSVSGVDVGDIAVTCVTARFSIGGSVAGLLGTGLQLTLDGSEALPVAADGSFQFIATVEDLQDYAVTVSQQPTGPDQVCVLADGSGTVSGSDVESLAVTCTTTRYAVSGSTQGLVDGEVDLRLNDNETITVTADGPFAFATPIDDGSAFLVEITREALQPLQRCALQDAAGTVDGGAVGNVLLACETLPAAIFDDGFED